MTMTLTLEIRPDLELRLKRVAAQQGLAADQCALHLLEVSLSDRERSSKALARLEADPLMAMAGVDDFDPVSIDEVVYR
jgi:hypothetical protein